jgi:hypothetical protein
MGYNQPKGWTGCNQACDGTNRDGILRAQKQRNGVTQAIDLERLRVGPHTYNPLMCDDERQRYRTTAQAP